MQVTQVSMTVDGEQVSGARTWLMDSAVGEGPQRLFRQVLYVRFVLDGHADGIMLVPAQTKLRGHFLPYEYDAKAVMNPALAAQMKAVGNALLVELDAPRQLRTVRLSNAFAPRASSKVTVHRVDGDHVVEEATTEAGWNNAFATLAVDRINQPFTRARPLRAVSGGAPNISHSQAQPFVQAINIATLAADFTDVRFGLRLRNNPTALTPNLLHGLTVRSYPSAPRLGLADPQTLTPTFFLRLAGEIGKDDDATAGQVDAGALLAGALQQYVDTFFAQLLEAAMPNAPQLPDQLAVALILESDAPCQLQLDEFVIGYQLVRRNFPDYAAKQLLRFAGTTVETQSITLYLPKVATVTQATLTVAVKLGTTGLAAHGAGIVLQPDALPQTTGIHLGLERWAAQPLTPAQALTASGVVLGLVALTPQTEIILELYEDWQGQPAGKKLTSATLSLAQSGARHWQTVHFVDPVLLFAQPYWLLLKAVRGAALWLVQPGASAVQMLILENQRWQALSVIANTEGLVHWLISGAAAQQVPSLALAIDNRPVSTPPVTTDDRYTYDLTAALNSALANQGAADLVDLALTITTGAAGLLTLYPPVIAYSI